MDPQTPSPSTGFEREFRRWAARVRRRLLLRSALGGAALGVTLGVALTAILFWRRLDEPRPWPLVLGAIGALVAMALATRRRWSDQDVALYLDAKLGTAECLVTAQSLADGPEPDPTFGYVVQSAGEALARANPKTVRPRVFQALHGLIPLGAAAIVGLSLAPLPRAPDTPSKAPGSERVRAARLRGLEKIEALENLRAKNPEQEARLKQLAERARKLRAELEKGMERREALSELGRLKDEIAAERLKLHDRGSRPGLEAALAELERNRRLSDAARALGEGDLTAFDKEMQKLANQAERDAREAAKEALKEAARAAREKGAGDVAEMLDAERELFGERHARAQALRDLARSLQGKLDPEALEALREFGESGSPEAQRKLGDALGKALESLSDEERKRLAERLERDLARQSPEQIDPLTRRQIEELARRLGSEDGQRNLEELLRELARAEPGDDAERERGLDDAERGGADAQRELGAVPIPMPGEPGSAGGPEQSAGPPGDAPNGASGPGSKKDTGAGDHAGTTPEVSGGELRAKADARLNPGLPLHAPTLGHAPGRAGETANQRGTGSLKSAAEAEVGAVERSDIPEEYREHVGRYFEP